MKVVIQIPCFNEAETLPATLADLPRQLPGVDEVEWLIIDDGSEDATVEVARRLGVDHVVCLPRNQGLARAFITGIRACLEAGADVIVNTDGDNQYRADDIPALIAPILEGRAEMVVGQRPIATIDHFSPLKKLLQKAGSWVVRTVSEAPVDDAPSGFRAFSRDAAMRLNVFSEYTYTLESLIQAGQKGMAIVSVPVRVNDPSRPSRLIRSIPRYILRSVNTIVRIFMTYRPFEFFSLPGIMALAAGFLLGLRFLYFFAIGEGEGHVQSVVLTALLLGLGFFLVIIGLLADLVSVNRKLLEDVQWQLRQLRQQVKTREARTEDAQSSSRSSEPPIQPLRQK